MRERPNLTVGSLVIAKRKTGVCDVGERGVCYEEYTLDHRPGWSFIFESGRHDGFSPDDVELILEITGEICPDVADYELTSVLRLRADFHWGHFASAFQSERRATVHEADPDPARTRRLPPRAGERATAAEPKTAAATPPPGRLRDRIAAAEQEGAPRFGGSDAAAPGTAPHGKDARRYALRPRAGEPVAAAERKGAAATPPPRAPTAGRPWRD